MARLELRVALDASRERLLDVETELSENLPQLGGHVVVADEDGAHGPGLDDTALGEIAVAGEEHAILGRRLTHQSGVLDLGVIGRVVPERAKPARQPAHVAVGEESGLHRSNLRIGRMASRRPHDELMERLRGEATGCYSWSNGPHDRYTPHSHEYEKVLYCVDGSITFVLESEGKELLLNAGDRMVLPAGTVHSAVVGPDGCTCIEGKR